MNDDTCTVMFYDINFYLGFPVHGPGNPLYYRLTFLLDEYYFLRNATNRIEEGYLNERGYIWYYTVIIEYEMPLNYYGRHEITALPAHQQTNVGEVATVDVFVDFDVQTPQDVAAFANAVWNFGVWAL